MSAFVLPLVVLAVGLLGGLGAALYVGRRPSAAVADSSELELADLEARQQELYDRLRHGEDLSDDERSRLERSAALVLRQIELLKEKRPAKKRRAKKATESDGPAATPSPATTASGGFRHPLLAGFLLGAGLALLVGVLVFWAVRDAKPDPAAQQAMAPPSSNGPEIDRGEPPLPPEIAARVAEMRRQLEQDPNNLPLLKELSSLLISHGQFFDAFQGATRILELDPEDPDGNYVSAVVRLTMGQAEPAIEHLDRALAAAPYHAPASMMKGLIQLQMGNREAAMATWQTGLDSVGGSHPGLEHVLSLAREGKSADEILAAPPPV